MNNSDSRQQRQLTETTMQQRTGDKLNMLISTSKTKCNMISKELRRCKLETEGKINRTGNDIQLVRSRNY